MYRERKGQRILQTAAQGPTCYHTHLSIAPAINHLQMAKDVKHLKSKSRNPINNQVQVFTVKGTVSATIYEDILNNGGLVTLW